MSILLFPSTPGQLYCRLPDPEIINILKGRFSIGSFADSSFGFILFLFMMINNTWPLQSNYLLQTVDCGEADKVTLLQNSR